ADAGASGPCVEDGAEHHHSAGELHLSPTGHLLVTVCLGFIGVMGIANNLLVLMLFCRCKVLRSPINLLLMNISLSDLLVCVLGTPFSFAASLQGHWLIGQMGCVWYGFVNTLFALILGRSEREGEAMSKWWAVVGAPSGKVPACVVL
uniref:Teleost multiple tissue opsin b n=1 Tax=Callorhinchus milii TaxID=7868 RepID=A0A4W3J626_CALMI